MIDKNKSMVCYPKDMDKQMIDLCDTINFFPGVQTIFCCSGHGKQPFYINLKFTNVKSIQKITKAFTTVDDDEQIMYCVKLSKSEIKKYTLQQQKNFIYNIQLCPLYEGYGEKRKTYVSLNISNVGLGCYMNNKRRKKEINRIANRLYEYLDNLIG